MGECLRMNRSSSQLALIKTDIIAAVSHNKFYWSCKYMPHVLTILRHLYTCFKMTIVKRAQEDVETL